MDVSREQVIDQIRQLNMVLVRSRMRVARAQLEQDEGHSWERALAASASVVRTGRGEPPASDSPADACAPSASDEPHATAVRAAAAEAPALRAATALARPRRCWDVVRATGGVPPHGVSTFHGQGRLLAILGLKPEISQKDLVYMLGMSRQAVGELLSKLEQKGYVEREPSEKDRRTMVVRLTDQGRAAARHLRERADEDAQLLDCLNERELADFSGYLQRIIDAAEARLPEDEFSERLRAMKEFMALNRAGEEEVEE